MLNVYQFLMIMSGIIVTNTLNATSDLTHTSSFENIHQPIQPSSNVIDLQGQKIGPFIEERLNPVIPKFKDSRLLALN